MIKDWWQDFGSAHPCNTVTQWCGTDTQDNPLRNLNYERDITYQFNEFGLRSGPLRTEQDKTNILVSGCSHTMGIGMPVELTWPHQLANMIPNSVAHNVALDGASGDYVARSISIALSHIRADLIFILWPDNSRLEFYNQNEINNLQVTSKQYPRILVDDCHHFNNYKKNRLLVDLLVKGIPVYHGRISLCDGHKTGLGRDGMHGCDLWHKSMADAFYFKYQHHDHADKFSCFDDIRNYHNVQSQI